jgi:hypothetical protein
MEPAPDRLGQGLSAAHDEGLPGDVLGLIRDAKQHRICDGRWLTKCIRGGRPLETLETIFACGIEAYGAAMPLAALVRTADFCASLSGMITLRERR